MKLHVLLDTAYGPDGDTRLGRILEAGVDLEERAGPLGEAPLHVATRRRRLSAVEILLAHGAEIDACTVGVKTAYAHAARRGFDEVAELLEARGADTSLVPPDRFAAAVLNGRIDEARDLLASHPDAARTGNPEEDRVLADAAGRPDPEPVRLLLAAGADLTAPGLDDGTPLHQAAWFGQPHNAQLLLEAGAPLDIFDGVHNSSPLGWAVHGSRYSGDAEAREKAYEELVRMLLHAGSSLRYPDDNGDSYLRRLREDARPGVLRELPERLPSR